MIIAQWIAAAMMMSGAGPAGESKRLDMEIAPAAAIDRTTTTDEVAIGRDVGDRMTVAVSVLGKGPYRFLVDTGAERTVISRQLAQRLRLESGKAAVLHSVIGANDVDTVYIPRLQVSSNTLTIIDAPALEASNIGADGMLGIDSLHSQRVLFDFKAKTMSITPSKRPLERLDGKTIVVRARTRHGRLIFSQARINGRKVTVVIDTGSQVSIGNPALLNSLAKKRKWALPDPILLESVTGEKMEARIAVMKRLELGDVQLGDVAVAFADAHVFRQLELEDEPALLLGMNAMRAFDRISIDFQSKKVRFVLPSTGMRESYRLASAGGM